MGDADPAFADHADSGSLLLSVHRPDPLPLLEPPRVQPPRPEEVFRYAVYDAGDAIEIDWAVDDGFYMYRSAFGFESADPAIVLGEPDAILSLGVIVAREMGLGSIPVLQCPMSALAGVERARISAGGEIEPL